MDVDQLKTTILNTRKAQDNFDKSKDFNKYDVFQPDSPKNRLLSVLQNSQNYERKFQEYMNSDIPKKAHKLKQIFKGLTIADIDMKNADHTSLLHGFINDYLKLDELKKNAFFKSRNQVRLPNVIFDVTLKKIEDLTSIYNYCEQAGYDHSNIHLVWILNDVTVAMSNNKTRSRRVADEIFMDTHIGASRTMNTILNNLNTVIPDTGVEVLDFIKGDIWVVFNVSGGDNRLVFSGRGGKYFERATKYLIKPKNSNKITIPVDVLNKIGGYVPYEKDVRNCR